jgi:hypothetical protein
MDQLIKQKWVAALRSGDYKQGRGALRTGSVGALEYCCLGVLCEIALKETGEGVWDYNSFIFRESRDMSYVPDKVKEWAGMSSSNPNIYGMLIGSAKVNSLAGANDLGLTFEEIADIIEKEF